MDETNNIDLYVEESYCFFKKTLQKFKMDKELKDNFHYTWVDGTADRAFRAWLSDRIQKHRDEYYNKKTNTETTIFDGGETIEPPPTDKQRQYIEDLGGDPWKPKTKIEASEYIEKLKKQKTEIL